MNEVRAEDEQFWRLETRAIGAGLAGGLLGGLAMGLLFQVGTDVMPVLGSFLGESSALRGWIVHLAISMFLGASFALVLGYPAIRDFTASFDTLEFALAGVTYVYAVAAVSIGILPFVFQLPWTATVVDPIFPQAGTSPTALVPAAVFALAHLVYGTILGAVYSILGT